MESKIVGDFVGNASVATALNVCSLCMENSLEVMRQKTQYCTMQLYFGQHILLTVCQLPYKVKS